MIPPPLDPHSALFLDLDGTLLEIAPRPELVRAPEGLPELLTRLTEQRGGALAVISGRRIDDFDRYLQPWRGAASGLHGAERRDAAGRMTASGDSPDDRRAAAALERLRPALRALERRLPGILVEDKGRTLAVHYRQAPNRESEVRASVDRLLRPEAATLRLIDGKMVLEMKPVHHDKGRAIAAFMEEAPFRGRVPVFVGDDTTDEDGFAEVNRRGGLSIRVGLPNQATAAVYALPLVAAVLGWLRGDKPPSLGSGGTPPARTRSISWQRTFGGGQMATGEIGGIISERPGEAPRIRRPHAVRVAGSRRRLVVVSNRVGPIAVGKASEGGLAVALRAALESAGGLWFGYSGTISDLPSETPKIETSGNIIAATLDLTRRDFEEYYIGYANRVLWPLFHYRPSLVGFSRRDLAGYLRVNRKFARALAPLLTQDDLVWVHDYHLIPLAEELRRLEVRNTIGFFLHTPFPAAEVLRLLPNHRDLVAALCAYDLVGFQTITDVHGFRDYLVRWCEGEELKGGAIRAFGRVVRAAVFPVGIDVEGIAALAVKAESSRQFRRLRDSIRDRALLIGVDRLDYSKGLPARFAAYSHLLEHFPQTRGRTVFLQIAPPSRSDVPEYQEIRRELEAAAGRINGRFAEFDWTPLRYLNKSFGHRILTGFYRAAKLALVTPLRDGMNLVVKEYLASQDPENPGMPILSCFAGAAHELGEAILVNPNDTEGVAEAVLQGLDMPVGERQERWNAMMATLRRNNTDVWRRRFVDELAAGAAR